MTTSDKESVRLEKNAFLVDWSWSKFSKEEILDENMLEMSSSVVRPSTMLLCWALLLPNSVKRRS